MDLLGNEGLELIYAREYGALYIALVIILLTAFHIIRYMPIRRSIIGRWELRLSRRLFEGISLAVCGLTVAYMVQDLAIYVLTATLIAWLLIIGRVGLILYYTLCIVMLIMLIPFTWLRPVRRFVSATSHWLLSLPSQALMHFSARLRMQRLERKLSLLQRRYGATYMQLMGGDGIDWQMAYRAWAGR